MLLFVGSPWLRWFWGVFLAPLVVALALCCHLALATCRVRGRGGSWGPRPAFALALFWSPSSCRHGSTLRSRLYWRPELPWLLLLFWFRCGKGNSFLKVSGIASFCYFCRVAVASLVGAFSLPPSGHLGSMLSPGAVWPLVGWANVVALGCPGPRLPWLCFALLWRVAMALLCILDRIASQGCHGSFCL